MDPITLLCVAFIVVYGLILGLVAPYVNLTNENFGSLVPTGLAIVSGSLLWALLTWSGMHYDEPWLWIIVMLGMPAAMYFGGRQIAKTRS